ncbi:MAG TPA: universal stress protein [Polyangiaceae bacterium]
MRYPIIAATDLSEASNDTLIQAEGRARRDGTPFTVVHVLPRPRWRVVNDSEALEQTRANIERHVCALTGRAPSEFEVIVERGVPHIVLARIAGARHGLLVVANHPQHGLAHALTGDVTERTVARANCPVLITRPRTNSGRVLVAVARAQASLAVLDAAAEEAFSSKATLVVLHCLDTGFIELLAADLINGGPYAAHPLSARSLVLEARDQLAAELRDKGVNYELHVVEGSPQVRIPEFAARTRAELIVLGSSHPPASLPRVTLAVLRHAPCSVLIVDQTDNPLERQAPLRVGVQASPPPVFLPPRINDGHGGSHEQ